MMPLAAGDGFVVHDLRIAVRSRAWSEPEEPPAHQLVFVRRGLYRLRADAFDGLVDPLTAYPGRPGGTRSIAHRPGTEDACTVLTFDPALAADLFGASMPDRPLCTAGRTDLAHRELLARARAGVDGFELAERVVRLVVGLRPARRPPGAALLPHGRRVVDAARELLVDDPASTSLSGLAARVGVSRSHLSRVFRQDTGETLTRFRNRLRVRAALDRIEAGEPSLARLAADLGYADHAHLTRALRAEVGHTPSAIRRLLAPA